jgi:amphi-Trp domain-containing protein
VAGAPAAPHHPRMADLLEIKRKDRMRREEAAARLRELADQLARHNELEFTRDGTTFRVKVPDEIEVEVELEVGDDGTELEIELSW